VGVTEGADHPPLHNKTFLFRLKLFLSALIFGLN
jgi:hypothetical protein